MKQKRINKLKEARSILECSIGPLGIFAGCDRYENQYWTRDFVLAGKDSLILLNRDEVIRKQLIAIAERQRNSGSIPSRFAKDRIHFAKKLFKEEVLGDWRYLFHKLLTSQIYLIKRNPLNFHRWFIWYADSEILFIIAAREYIDKTNDKNVVPLLNQKIDKAFNYIEKKLMQDGLVVGSDWRDTVYSLSDKHVFNVNIMLWRAYMLNDKKEKANKLRERIEKSFYNGNFYSDTPGDYIFDTLGHSLAILWNFIPEERYKKILDKYNEMETPFGYKANNMIFPKELLGYIDFERTNQFSTVWPFIHGYAILALIHMRKYDLVKKQMKVWNKIDNFYEWYSSESGEGRGAKEQMWSAALYLIVDKAIVE